MMFGVMMCKAATRLMSKRLDKPLTFSERVSLRMHLGMCDACRQCNRQFDLLHRAGQRRADEVAEAPDDKDETDPDSR